MTGPDRDNPDHALVNDQGVTSEGDHPLGRYPRLIPNRRITDNRVADQRPSLVRNMADFAFANRDASVNPVEAGVQPGAGSENEDPFFWPESKRGPAQRSGVVPRRPAHCVSVSLTTSPAATARPTVAASAFSLPCSSGRRRPGVRPMSSMFPRSTCHWSTRCLRRGPRSAPRQWCRRTVAARFRNRAQCARARVVL